MPAADARRLTSRYQRAQEAVGVMVAKEAASEAASWLRTGDIDDGLDDFIARVTRLVMAGRATSENIAAAYYEALRAAEGITSPRPFAPRRLFSINRPIAGLIYTGPRYAKALTRRDETQNLHKVVGEAVGRNAMRHTLNAGRSVIFDSVSSDPDAWGWARLTDADPCNFCAMLAGRGPVYKTAESAGELNRWHDGCACTVIPVLKENQ